MQIRDIEHGGNEKKTINFGFTSVAGHWSVLLLMKQTQIPSSLKSWFRD